ncbi:putative TRAP-type C4-dicarboxylate transport system, small permease component [Pusillimonas sp. T7-7]|uniref:TRAP transporter small permease subunit n=1 Tax=Pusillimonas sp. (strain T7-7) TaxID=1007105 RepID=UPI0002084717|nr:TRAP transporter small permease subunit [Pusillimonas sp. T7-7]AEC18702.1 putative TRAP-type C4-dicarboxylate transport system, small permease component [Pusillimonas sp. T7-7]
MALRFINLVQALSRACGVLSALLLTFSMVVVCQMILMRYVFRAATIWQTEAVVFSATAAIFLGAPYVLLTKGHVGVDVIKLMAKPRTQLKLDYIGSTMGLLFCLIMVVGTGIHLYEALEGGWTTPSVAAVPLWMPLTPMLAGFVLLSLQYLAELIKLAGESS